MKPNTPSILAILCVIALMALQSCDNCGKQICPRNGAWVRLKILSNGKNALFGSNAFIDHNSVEYKNVDTLGFPAAPVVFNNATQRLEIFIDNDAEYQLKLGNFTTDIYDGDTFSYDYDGCCHFYEIVGVRRNGQDICDFFCTEVDIEL